MKKYKVFCLALLFVFLVVGCDSESNSTNSISRQDIPGIDGASYSPVTTMLCLPPGRNHHDSQKALDRLSEIAKKYFNMNLKLRAAITHELFLNEMDAMVVRNDEELRELIDKNIIMDLTEMFRNHAPNYYSQFTQEELARVTYDGKIMAIPNRSFASNRISVAVRSDLLQDLNIDSITNFEEYEDFLKAAEKLDSNLVSTSLIAPKDICLEYYGYVEVPCGMVYRWDDPEYKLIPVEAADEIMQLLKMQYDWINAGYFNPPAAATNTRPYYHTFSLDDLFSSIKSGKLASFITRWNSGIAITRIVGEKHGYKIFPLDLNKVAFEDPVSMPVIVIRKGSKNAERILQFIDWIHSSQENYDLVMYGVEGENYTLENGMVKLPEKAGMIHYYWRGFEAFLNEKYERKFVTDEESNIMDYSPKNDANLKPLPTAGFLPRMGGILEKGNERIHIIGDTFVTAFLFNVDIDRAYSVTMEDIEKRTGNISISRILTEMQKQLDEWRKSS